MSPRQLSLDDPPALIDAYPAGRDALSREAFESIDGRIRKRLQADVYDAIAGSEDGCTTDEIEVALGGRHQSVSPRVIELERAGLIRRTEEKRATRSGRRAWVYRATAQETWR